MFRAFTTCLFLGMMCLDVIQPRPSEDPAPKEEPKDQQTDGELVNAENLNERKQEGNGSEKELEDRKRKEDDEKKVNGEDEEKKVSEGIKEGEDEDEKRRDRFPIENSKKVPLKIPEHELSLDEEASLKKQIVDAAMQGICTFPKDGDYKSNTSPNYPMHPSMSSHQTFSPVHPYGVTPADGFDKMYNPRTSSDFSGSPFSDVPSAHNLRRDVVPNATASEHKPFNGQKVICNHKNVNGSVIEASLKNYKSFENLKNCHFN